MTEGIVDRVLRGPQEGPVGKAWAAIESGYDSLGLMTGASAPAKRFIFGNLVGSGLVLAIQPSFAYSKGKQRPWALTNPGAPNKTALPWWMPGLAFGFFSGFLV